MYSPSDNKRTFAVDRNGSATVYATKDFKPGRYPSRQVGSFVRLAGAAIAGVAAGSFLVAPAVQNAPVEPVTVWHSGVDVRMLDDASGGLVPAACVQLDEFTEECVTDSSGSVIQIVSTPAP